MLPSRVPSYTSGRQKRTAARILRNILAKVSKDNTHPARFYCSLEYLRTLRGVKNARLTYSQKYLAKVSKDNAHPALFCCPLEYLRTLRGVKNARLHAFSEIFGIKVSKDNTHPARFYCSFEYHCKMCSRRQRKLR